MSYGILFLSLVLFLAALGLLVRHRRVWIEVKERSTDARELDFRRRQYLRRMETGLLLAILAASLALGEVLVQRYPTPMVFTLYCGLVLFSVLWILLLALSDAIATRQHLLRADHQEWIKKAERVLDEYRKPKPGSNGKVIEGNPPNE